MKKISGLGTEVCFASSFLYPVDNNTLLSNFFINMVYSCFVLFLQFFFCSISELCSEEGARCLNVFILQLETSLSLDNITIREITNYDKS